LGFIRVKIFLLGMTVMSLLVPSLASADEAVVRVLTYNIHHGEGTDGALDLERIARVIRAAEADVVCLQEVDRNLPRTERIDIAAVLAEMLGMTAVFDANYRFSGGEYGNATLSRLPIVHWENRALPGPDGVEPRGSLRVDVEVAGATLHVLNTHLGLRPEERLEQARALLEQAAGLERVVLAGDLNAVPGSEPMAALGERFVDTAAALGADEATSPSTAPRRRIDYVLVTPDLEAREARTGLHDEAGVASDHLPYVAAIRIPRGNPAVR
jgi:endonuclease/exonuclease/phosphatase family metal-dependent hydrolase